MAGQTRIHMMGTFAIEANGEVYEHLVSKTRKGVSLLQYLIMERGRTVPSQRLIRELWAGHRSESPENALKTMVSRVRAMLHDISPELAGSLVSGKGGYSWQSKPGVTVDALEIIGICERLRSSVTPEERTLLTDSLQALYRGDLFQTGDLNNGITLVNWLHREYLDAVLRYIEQLKNAEKTIDLE